jgi:hypothetical protein
MTDEIFERLVPGTELVNCDIEELYKCHENEPVNESLFFNTICRVKLDKTSYKEGIPLSRQTHYISGFDFDVSPDLQSDIPEKCSIHLGNGLSVRRYNIVKSTDKMGYELRRESNPDELAFLYISLFAPFSREFIQFDKELPDGITLYQFGGSINHKSNDFKKLNTRSGSVTDRFRNITYTGVGTAIFS